MARKQKITGRPMSNGLDRPFPSSPTIPPKYSLTVTKDGRLITASFVATYAAKKYLESIVMNDNVLLSQGITGEMDTLSTDTDITIRSSQIQEILDYEYSSAEAEWELPVPYSSDAMRIRAGGYEAPQVNKAERIPREKKEKVEKTPKASKAGMISISEIAAQLKMEPRDARAILRKMKIEKTDNGWNWFENQVDDIKKIIQNNK